MLNVVPVYVFSAPTGVDEEGATLCPTLLEGGCVVPEPLIVLDGKIIWREPPVMLAVSYSDASSALSSNQPVLQQLLGGMQLAEASTGVLFSPLLADPPAGLAWTDSVQPDQHMYSKQLRGQSSIRLYKLVPDLPTDLLRQRLHAALQHATEALPERPTPACHGILSDRDTVNASRRNDQPGNVLCPKPHIGPGISDLVDDRLHCLKDPRLCHVYGQPITPPFVIRVDTLDGPDKKSGDLRTRSEEKLREAEWAEQNNQPFFSLKNSLLSQSPFHLLCIERSE